jgi:predicted transcriptional regulator
MGRRKRSELGIYFSYGSRQISDRSIELLFQSTLLGFAMTTKEKAISLIQSLDDDVSLDDVIDKLYLLRKIEIGIAQADAGDVMEHDEFMDELEAEDAQ